MAVVEQRQVRGGAVLVVALGARCFVSVSCTVLSSHDEGRISVATANVPAKRGRREKAIIYSSVGIGEYIQGMMICCVQKGKAREF